MESEDRFDSQYKGFHDKREDQTNYEKKRSDNRDHNSHDKDNEDQPHKIFYGEEPIYDLRKKNHSKTRCMDNSCKNST